MKQARIGAALLAALSIGCVATVSPQIIQQGVPGSRPYYVTRVAYSFTDSTAEAVRLHLDDRLLVWLGGWLQGARAEGLEPAACLRVASRHGSDIYVDSLLSADSVSMRSPMGVAFKCQRDQVPVHGHVVENGWQCIASAKDTGPAWAPYPAEAMICGVGIDSISAWKARRR